MEQAIQENNIELVKTLLEEGLNPNEDGTHYLFLTSNNEIRTLLIHYGADTTAADEFGFTLQDYDEELPKQIVDKPVKFIQYRGTKKSKNGGRAKTRRAKQSGESS
jgi:hypothetical protein